MANLSGQFTKLNVNQEPLCYNSHPPTEIIGKEGQKIFIFQSSRLCGFSNRFPSRFSVLGINFTTMEKYFTWQKARYFADFEIAEHILQLQNPDQITALVIVFEDLKVMNGIKCGIRSCTWVFGQNSLKMCNSLRNFVKQAMH
uniref:Uncharacterized protein n=1 Tax=Meloidogyne enterolobii TaxID=390850 RepID=A0A6V7Y7W0_MELEN|nr:unnamed protein product [Meloidogyne enterolobii]